MDRLRIARLAEAARLDAERERLKSDLLAGVSHDLRTPLSTIVFTLQSLQRFASEHSPDVQAELLALAEMEARRLADMVDTLLDASRIGATGAPVRLEAIELSALVEQVRRALGAEADGREIDVQVAQDMPLICADALLASRALANVISNALRHGGDGAVSVAARRDGGDIVLDISDRGPGLGADAERLFVPFVRGVQGDGRAPGLGLGLSIARKFLGAQGATITAEDRKGGGALFSVRFACAGGQHVD